MSSMPQRVGGLVHNEAADKTHVPLPPNSQRYRCVEAIIDMALCILESPQGRQSLVALANQLVALRNAKKKPQKHLYTGSPEDMHMAINLFLQKIRSSFPFVFLTLFDGEGVTTKEEGEWGDSLQNYEPQRAVWLALHSHIIDNMLFARQQSKEVAGHSYALFKFQMVITVAHEVCHMLTNFLTGADRPHTPPGLKVAGYGNRMTGESGRWWEVQMFGGLVEFYANQRDPLGARQAGVPYLMTNGNPKSPARQLSINYVLDFVNGNYSYPARASSNAPLTTRQALRGSSREVSELRPKGISKAPPTSSPPRDNTPSGSGSVGSSSSAWRRLPFGFSRRSAGRSG